MVIFKYNTERPFRDDPDLCLKYWGKEDCAPGHSVGPGVRDLYKVHFVHKGKGIVRVGDHTYTLSPGQAFLIYPHIVTYYEADRQQPWTYSWIAFYGADVAPTLSRTLLSPEHPVFPMDMKVMPGMYDQLTEALQREGNRDLRFKAIMYDFLSALVETIPANAAGRTGLNKRDAYVHQSIEYLHAHYSEDITVRQLASFLGLDRKYLSAIFKAAIGMPPQQYLLNYRLQKACELLEKDCYTIGEVARSVGYQDALLFSRMFKKVKGVSPKSYRDKSDK
ncbi:AraC family transcriptional regulator [Paenibacillus alkalitolerans]|uniref:AraC family transcriptional regulator n=1 Tax=Paenibacillus alkalitolerans TaxID=2799335 RepID=UPI0018F4FEB5|nr:AraC family transcriptional regulator [Paenibacillus alkalitolerans]